MRETKVTLAHKKTQVEQIKDFRKWNNTSLSEVIGMNEKSDSLTDERSTQAAFSYFIFMLKIKTNEAFHKTEVLR